MADRRRIKTGLLTLSKYLIALGAFLWIIYSIDINESISTIKTLSLTTILFIIIASGIGVIARALLWHPLVSKFTNTNAKELIMSDIVISFVNTLFPSRLSGRSIAPITLRHYTELNWSQVTAVTVAHTGLHALLYGFVGLIGLISTVATYRSELAYVILLSIFLYLSVGLIVILVGWRLDIFDRLADRLARSLAPLPVGNSIAAALNSFRSKLLDGSDKQVQLLLRNLKTVGLFVMTWIIAVMIVPAIRIWILFSATGISGIEMLLLPLYIVVAYSVTILPLTPGGIGVAEATAVAVFLALGAPEGAIATVVFLDRFFGLYLPSLFGWFPLAQTDLRTIVD